MAHVSQYDDPLRDSRHARHRGILRGKLPKFMRGLISGLNYETIIRTVRHDAKLHPTVRERFKLPSVVQCAKVGKYLPGALKDHSECKAYYPPSEGPSKWTVAELLSPTWRFHSKKSDNVSYGNS
jgi:hypothetical protein